MGTAALKLVIVPPCVVQKVSLSPGFAPRFQPLANYAQVIGNLALARATD